MRREAGGQGAEVVTELCPGLDWHRDLYLNARVRSAEGVRLHVNDDVLR